MPHRALHTTTAALLTAAVLALSPAVAVTPAGAAAAAPLAPPAVRHQLDWATAVVDRANISMSSPVIVPRPRPFVVVADEGGNVRAFHVDDGSPVPGWGSVDAGYDMLRAPLSTDGTNVYLPVAQDGQDSYPSFKKFGPDGRLLWNSNPGISDASSLFLLAGMSLAQVDGRWTAIGASSGHWYYRIDAATGAKQWGFRNADSTMATPAVADLLGVGQPQVVTSNDKSPETPADKAGGHLRILTMGGRQVCSADQPVEGLTYAESGYNNSSPAIAEVAGHPLIVFGSTGPVQSGPGGNQIVGYDATCKLRWASAPLAGRAEPSPTFADVVGDATPEVLTMVEVVAGGSRYPRVYVLDARTGATLRDSGTSLSGFGAGHIRYTQASSIVTADANGDGVQDLFVPASKLIVLDGASGQLIGQLDLGGATTQNTPVLSAEPDGSLRVTLAGYAGNNGRGQPGAVVRSWLLPDGELGQRGWPRFGHDSQLTGTFAPLDGPYDQLVEGQTLPSGGVLRSRSNGYTARMQADGNLVLYRANGSWYWQSRTNGNPGARLVVTSLGELRILSTTGNVLWRSFATGPGVERVVLGTDGHLRATSGTWVGSERTNADRLLWSTDPRDALPRDRLYAGQALAVGSGLVSQNGALELLLQTDGNLVLYRSGRPRWWTGTRDLTGRARLAMQDDGNMVLYGAYGVLKNFAINGRGGLRLELLDDGQLRVVTAGGGVVWRVWG